MIEITRGVYACALPDGATEINIMDIDEETYLVFEVDNSPDEIELPTNYKWEIVSKGDKVSEEQAAEMIEKVLVYDEEDLRAAEAEGEDYEYNLVWPAFKPGGEPYADRCQYTALQSYYSLMEAKGQNPATSLILKRTEI
jgi:hypothetical protein